MDKRNMLNIEIAYLTAQQQLVVSLQVTESCTVEEAIQQSGILVQFPEIDLSQNKVGIFSKIVSLNTALQSGDRIEIYQPLLIDPKQARKQRAKRKSTIGNK